jgi:hypothetical protein
MKVFDASLRSLPFTEDCGGRPDEASISGSGLTPALPEGAVVRVCQPVEAEA